MVSEDLSEGPGGSVINDIRQRAGGALSSREEGVDPCDCFYSGSKAQYKGIPEIMGCRILVFMWSFGPLYKGITFRSPRKHLTLAISSLQSEPLLTYINFINA